MSGGQGFGQPLLLPPKSAAACADPVVVSVMVVGNLMGIGSESPDSGHPRGGARALTQAARGSYWAAVCIPECLG